MEKFVNVATGEVTVCEGAGVLKSTAIGSCVVIAGCDTQKNLGVMAHVMLPGQAPKNISSESTRYAINAIDKMISMISLKGANIYNFEVCLVGGANVLKKHDDSLSEDSPYTNWWIEGEKLKNLEEARTQNIPLPSEPIEVYYDMLVEPQK